MKNNKIYILHILDAIDKILRYTKGVTIKRFLANDEKKDAVVRNIEIIGEAAAHLPVSFRKKFASIPWRNVIDMRNRLIHEYFGVDYQIVWNVIEVELPELRKRLSNILHET